MPTRAIGSLQPGRPATARCCSLSRLLPWLGRVQEPTVSDTLSYCQWSPIQANETYPPIFTQARGLRWCLWSTPANRIGDYGEPGSTSSGREERWFRSNTIPTTPRVQVNGGRLKLDNLRCGRKPLEPIAVSRSFRTARNCAPALTNPNFTVAKPARMCRAGVEAKVPPCPI
jgi:hypothetical protein